MGKVQISCILKEVVHIITLCFKGLIFQKLKISQKLLLIIQSDWLPYVGNNHLWQKYHWTAISVYLVLSIIWCYKNNKQFSDKLGSHSKPDRDWLFLLDPPFYLRIKEQFLTHLFCLEHYAMDRAQKFILSVIYRHQNHLQLNQNTHFLVRFCLPS